MSSLSLGSNDAICNIANGLAHKINFVSKVFVISASLQFSTNHRVSVAFAAYSHCESIASSPVSLNWFSQFVLKLRVNTEKSAVRYAGHMELLGYGIYRMRTQKFGLKVIESNWQKFVRNCKRLTKKSKSFSFVDRVEQLRTYCQGWIGYFRYANIKTRLIKLDRLLGSRLRYCIWKSWKRIRTRIRNLKKLGVPEWKAVKLGFTRRGGWHSQSRC